MILFAIVPPLFLTFWEIVPRSFHTLISLFLLFHSSAPLQFLSRQHSSFTWIITLLNVTKVYLVIKRENALFGYLHDSSKRDVGGQTWTRSHEHSGRPIPHRLVTAATICSRCWRANVWTNAWAIQEGKAGCHYDFSKPFSFKLLPASPLKARTLSRMTFTCIVLCYLNKDHEELSNMYSTRSFVGQGDDSNSGPSLRARSVRGEG